MKCLLCASWKPYTTHPLAGYTHQLLEGIEWLCELISTSLPDLQASNRSSGNAERQRANWKLPVWCRWLTVWICLETTGLEDNMRSACRISASRHERDILDHVKLVCTFSQRLQILSLTAPCKCMHECLTQVLTRTVARFTKSRLISLRASFKYKLCDTNSSDLSVWSSFAPFCICTAVPNGLPVLAFANSKHSHCKRIPNDSKPVLAWFERMPSAPIFLHLSTKTGVSLDGKSCTAGIDTTEPWLCPSNLALRSIDCIGFRVKSHLPPQKHVQSWRELVPGNVSLPVVERWLWGARKNIGRVNRFRSDRRFRRSELKKFESICLPGTPKIHVALVIRLRLFFLVITDAFCTGKCGHVCFFSTWSARLFFNKMLKNYGFAVPLASEPRPYMAIFAHIWPYLPIYRPYMTNFFGHPESAASIRFDQFFYPLRVFLINDQKNCPLRDLATMTKKHGISGFQVREQQSQPRLLGSIIFHRIPWVCAVMEGIQWVAWRTCVWTYVSLSWCLHAFGQSKSSDAMPWAKVSAEFDSPFQGEHSFETSSSSYTKKVSVPVAASNAHWWKDHARIQRSLAGIPSV